MGTLEVAKAYFNSIGVTPSPEFYVGLDHQTGIFNKTPNSYEWENVWNLLIKEVKFRILENDFLNWLISELERKDPLPGLNNIIVNYKKSLGMTAKYKFEPILDEENVSTYLNFTSPIDFVGLSIVYIGGMMTGGSLRSSRKTPRKHIRRSTRRRRNNKRRASTRKHKK